MAKTRSMTRNNNLDDGVASDKNNIESCDNCGVALWSDVNHDVLFLVMMQLGVIDFLSFSGVCKSWRSLALSNKTMFMATKPPMFIRLSPCPHNDVFCLTGFEGRKFKTIIPRLVGRTCFGSTCGYLILYGSKERDIWLVNPITRHELYFPDVPSIGYFEPEKIRGILVFSASISGWVFVMVNKLRCDIWFSVAGKGGWSRVISTFPIFDLHAFKGKIYILKGMHGKRFLSELRLYPEPNLSKLKFKNYPETSFCLDLLSFNANLYLMEIDIVYHVKVHELDFEEMKWVLHENMNEEYAFFLNNMGHAGAFKQESLADPCLISRRYINHLKKSEERRFLIAKSMWYFPCDCLNVDCVDGDS